MREIEVAEAVVGLQHLVTQLQKLTADSQVDRKIIADHFRKIMDVAATGWVWSEHG
jgi:hypothetical protein